MTTSPQSTSPVGDEPVHLPATVLLGSYEHSNWVALTKNKLHENHVETGDWDRWECGVISMAASLVKLTEEFRVRNIRLLNERWISNVLSQNARFGRRVWYKAIAQPKIESDLDWFASGEADTERFKGMYIAIRNKEILGWGASSQEAYKMAKSKRPELDPAVTYVPETEDSLF
jgi:hypothetical protein